MRQKVCGNCIGRVNSGDELSVNNFVFIQKTKLFAKLNNLEEENSYQSPITKLKKMNMLYLRCFVSISSSYYALDHSYINIL